MKILKIPNQIIREPLTPLNLKRVNYIVLHHMANPVWGVKEVENYHVNKNGWNAIGYNYFITYNGEIYEGRGYKNMGAGVANHNSHIISIGFQGNYHPSSDIPYSTKMPDEQFNAGVQLIKYLLSLLPNADEVVGHKAFGGSVCPGDYFPLEEMIKLNERNGLNEMEKAEFERRLSELERKVDILEQSNIVYDWTTACPKWSIPYVQKALDEGKLKGDEKGRLRLTDAKIFAIVSDYRNQGVDLG